MLKIFLLLSIALLFCFSKEHTTVHWNTVSFPPSLITKGELKNQGYSDIVRNIIIKNMSSYQHNVEIGNTKLAVTNLRRLEFSCFSGLNRNEEREKFTYFSKPTILSLPNELIIKKSNQHKFRKYLTSDNKIDLFQILKDDILRFGYVDSRAYHNYIDDLIQKFKSNKNSFARKGADLTKGLVYMLSRDRLDYIIEYPTMIKYNKEELNIKEEFLQYPIKNASELIKVYVGCNKSMYGKNLIDNIDEIIINQKEEFVKAYKKWLPKNSLKRYKEITKKK